MYIIPFKNNSANIEDEYLSFFSWTVLIEMPLNIGNCIWIWYVTYSDCLLCILIFFHILYMRFLVFMYVRCAFNLLFSS